MAEEIFATPYADVRNPFSVSEKGAFADYILRSPEKMPDLVLGSSVLIKDQRDGNEFWIVGTVVDVKMVSPFQMEREHQLYIDEEGSNPNSLLPKVSGPHTYQPMLIQVRLDREILKTDNKDQKFIASALQRPPSATSGFVYLFLISNLFLHIKPSFYTGGIID